MIGDLHAKQLFVYHFCTDLLLLPAGDSQECWRLPTDTKHLCKLFTTWKLLMNLQLHGNKLEAQSFRQV